MFTHKDKIIKDNTAKRKEWEKKHPNQDWKTDLSSLDKDKLVRQSKGDNTLFYKKDNIKVQYGEPIELKIDGKKSKLNGKLIAETIQLGDEITKKEYDAI